MLKPAFGLYLAWLSYPVVPLKNVLSPADIVLLNTFMNTQIQLTALRLDTAEADRLTSV